MVGDAIAIDWAIDWPAWPYGQLLSLFVLVALAAFFASSEAALLHLNRHRLRNQVRLGNRNARRTEELLLQPDRLMNTVVLCKTIVTVGAAVLACMIALRLGRELALGLAAGALVMVLLVVAEIAPKTYGKLYSERVALGASRIFFVLVVVLHPLVWSANQLAKSLLSMLSITSAAESPTPAAEGPQPSQRILASILDLESVTVEDIMVPRSEIASVDISDDWDTILEMLRTTPHTRLPLCEDNLDNIVGILHMKKIAHALVHGDLSRATLLTLAREREAYFVPEGTTLNVQLRNFQRDRRRIALVVDEYGDIRGLVTLEDILEEIVGEFTSDPATLHRDIHREADGSYVVSGTLNVRVLNRTLGWTLPTDGPRTLNGLILEYLEHIPEAGTSLKLGHVSVEILQAVDNAVKTARLRPVAAAPDASTQKNVASKGAA